MTDLDLLKSAIQRSMELWDGGSYQEALNYLENQIAEAKLKERNLAVRILSRQAAGIAEANHELQIAKHYLEQVIALGDQSAFTYYALADVLRQGGKDEDARRYAQKSYDLSEHLTHDEAQDLIDVLRRRWPDIARSK